MLRERTQAPCCPAASAHRNGRRTNSPRAVRELRHGPLEGNVTRRPVTGQSATHLHLCMPGSTFLSSYDGEIGRTLEVSSRDTLAMTRIAQRIFFSRARSSGCRPSPKLSRAPPARSISWLRLPRGDAADNAARTLGEEISRLLKTPPLDQSSRRRGCGRHQRRRARTHLAARDIGQLRVLTAGHLCLCTYRTDRQDRGYGMQGRRNASR